jgi:uncharacterized protein
MVEITGELMKRDIEQHLLNWKNQASLKPLVLRGARQVGKTYVVKKFASTHFEHFININFELEPRFISCFDSLDTAKIIPMLQVVAKQTIIPGKSLIFFDEIQECPQALVALRYFKEQMPGLHVVAAGSLLEFCLNQEEFRMPVGRVQFLYLYPMSFKEYLYASGNQHLLNYLQEITLTDGVNPAIHQSALEEFTSYMAIGGMPDAVTHFIEHRDYNHVDVIQRAILETYRGDFGKYGASIKISCLQAIYKRAPGMVAQHFKFSQVDSEMKARDLRPALNALNDAGLIYSVHSSQASGIPLSALVNEKFFKLLFLDIGLVRQASGISVEAVLNNEFMLLNQGALTEQFVGQELLAYGKPDQKEVLYYWERNQSSSTAEVDYVLQQDTNIIPIEVKSGSTGRMKSLQLFLKEKQRKIGVRISQHELQLTKNVLSVPLYMICELPRLLKEI